MGVKSFGWENSTAQESPIQSWNLIGPSVVSASKSGAVSPICRAIRFPSGSDENLRAAACDVEVMIAKSPPLAPPRRLDRATVTGSVTPRQAMTKTHRDTAGRERGFFGRTAP